MAGKILTGRTLAAAIQPALRSSVFTMPGWLVWCGSIIHDDAGLYWLFFSCWPAGLGHQGWVTSSLIGCASAASPLGPFTFQKFVLAGSGIAGRWDRDVTHNPVIVRDHGLYYLFYMGNYGDGTYWDHRNHQRIGVAVADHPLGPWKRNDRPLIDIDPGFCEDAGFREPIGTLMVSNPSVTQVSDGRWFMIYKAVGNGPLPKGGRVICGIAVANQPDGPYIKHPHPIMVNPENDWSVEDPFIWCQDNQFYALVKDFQGYFTGRGQSTIALFLSSDGLDWQPAEDCFVMTREVRWEDGSCQPVTALERPQIYFEQGIPKVLACAVAFDEARNRSANVQFPLRFPPAGSILP